MDPRWVLIAIPVAIAAFLVGYFTGRNSGYWDGYGVATSKAVENNKALRSLYQNEAQQLKLELEAMSREIELLYLKGELK
jgi:hypothetical protein